MSFNNLSETTIIAINVDINPQKKPHFGGNASVEIPIINEIYCRSVREPTRRRRANFVKTRLTL